MKKKNKALFILLILFIGIGFAYISTNLNILGNNSFGKGTWKIYFDNVNEVSGSDLATIHPTTIGTTTTELTYGVSFDQPGDVYLFSVDVVNDSSSDAMINLIDNYELTPAEREYCKYDIFYESGQRIEKDQLLKSGKRLKIMVRIEYNREISEEVYAMDKNDITFNLSIEYTIADKYAKGVPVSFAEDDWDIIAYAVRTGEYPYRVGDTKCVHLNGYSTTNDNGCNGDFKVRVANTSTPSECNQANFSQSACGFVIEFEDLLTYHVMNPVGQYQESQYDYGWNKDGWPASSMKEFVNNDIYNSLPDMLKENIIDTYTISGYGKDDANGKGPEGNWESIDKLYLFASREVWGQGINYDSACNYTRQLDYYSNLNVSISNCSAATKYINGGTDYWWLRSAYTFDSKNFYSVTHAGYFSSSNASYITGVSPAFRL